MIHAGASGCSQPEYLGNGGESAFKAGFCFQLLFEKMNGGVFVAKYERGREMLPSPRFVHQFQEVIVFD